MHQRAYSATQCRNSGCTPSGKSSYTARGTGGVLFGLPSLSTTIATSASLSISIWLGQFLQLDLLLSAADMAAKRLSLIHI